MQSVLFVIIKLTVWILRCLSADAAVAVGSFSGWVMYCLDCKHRDRVYQNLKIALADQRSLKEIRVLTRKYFVNLGANFAEFLRLPMSDGDELQKNITYDGLENFQNAMAEGKGAVLMTIHYGNWELPMLALCAFGYPANLIFKIQESASAFNTVMVACRKDAYERFEGVKLFERGIGARQLITALKQNELIGMVIDQGGKEGVPVEFFGRQARFSPGGMRLALKVGAPMCVGVLKREKGCRHRLIIRRFDSVFESEDEKENAVINLQKAIRVMEEMAREAPEQYMWLYKIWKFDPSQNVMILDDGRVGHLRQSEAVACIVKDIGDARGGETAMKSIRIRYRQWPAKYFVLLTALGHRVIPNRCALKILQWCLDRESFLQLCAMKADVVVSAGSFCAPVNSIISREHRAKRISLLRPSILPWSYFHVVILPEHDLTQKNARSPKLILTKGAPNLVTDAYLKESAQKLLQRYSHLKLINKFTIGVMVGGDTKDYVLDEALAKILVNQVKEAAEQLNADILITTSRRTSEKVENLFMREFKKHPRCRLLVLANRNNIPEAVGGILGLSDVLIISGDSISMVSEAASSGKRTVVFPVKRRAGSRGGHKHNRFVDRLNREGYILCSDPKLIGQSIFNLAKNKIYTRKLDDGMAIRERLHQIV